MFRDSELASIVFICDSSDGLEEDRFKIFQNWQYTYAKEAELIQAVFYLAEYELYYYVGIIPLNSIHQEILAEELSNPDIISIKNN